MTGVVMVELMKALAIAACAIVFLRSGMLAFRLLKGDLNSYEHNRIRTGSLRQAVFGEVPTEFDGRRDYRVAAGIALNRKTNTWVEQGRLSVEAIQATLSPKS